MEEYIKCFESKEIKQKMVISSIPENFKNTLHLLPYWRNIKLHNILFENNMADSPDYHTNSC